MCGLDVSLLHPAFRGTDYRVPTEPIRRWLHISNHLTALRKHPNLYGVVIHQHKVCQKSPLSASFETPDSRIQSYSGTCDKRDVLCADGDSNLEQVKGLEPSTF